MDHRITYIDVSKTICIFLMVVGHWTSNRFVLTYIYSFHMPAFFIISGMLYKPRSFIKTCLAFGIPVAFYSIVNLLFLLLVGDVNIRQVLTREMVFRFFHYRYGLGDGLFMGDWFIWALVAIRMVMGDVQIFNGFRIHFLFLSMIIVSYMSFGEYFISIDTIFRGWYIGRAIPSLPFFCFGLYLKTQRWIPKRIPKYALFVMVFVAILFPIVNGYSSINENVYGRSYVFFLFNAVVSTLLLLYMSSKTMYIKVFSVFSKGTLFVLGVHIPILRILDMAFPSYFHEFLPILVLLICYFPILWLDRFCPVLLGKIKRDVFYTR